MVDNRRAPDGNLGDAADGTEIRALTRRGRFFVSAASRLDDEIYISVSEIADSYTKWIACCDGGDYRTDLATVG